MVLDAGPASAGLESTIVALTVGPARLLRHGPISAEVLEMAFETRAGGIEAPGQLRSHYKPGKPLALNRLVAENGEWLIGFGAVPGDSNLSPGGDLEEAAAQLYARLFEADASARARIAVAPIPFQGIGAAINDRLARAAAP